LTAIAIPSYKKYTVRAQATEALTPAYGWETAIAGYYAIIGTTAGSNTLVLHPYTNANGDLLWRCGLAATPSGGTAVGATVGSTVPPRYLPTSCRS
jgi:Tfp pilus assembly major pilin PilA